MNDPHEPVLYKVAYTITDVALSKTSTLTARR